MKAVTIYSTPTCPWCKRAKAYFDQKGVSFVEYNVADDSARAEEMVQRSGQMGVPVIDINGEIIVGFDQPRIDALLTRIH